ncbi:MAG: NADH:ubiquinone oxidoreductase subunit NDUFA12 [Alphaproteobacteria bacterium]
MSATIGTLLHSFLYGRYVGRDEFGNRYYEARRARNTFEPKRRWVIYRGQAEPSKVPASWHGWLHYTLARPLEKPRQYNWQKEHLPNLTGTSARYVPQGHITKGKGRAPATADYEPWKPE